jgi:hypothetical protein
MHPFSHCWSNDSERQDDTLVVWDVEPVQSVDPGAGRPSVDRVRRLWVGCPVSAPTDASRRTWTLEEVRALGLTCDVPTAGQILGISRSLAYEMVRDQTFPVRVLRFRRAARVAVPDLLHYLGAGIGAPTPLPAPEGHLA